MDVVLMYRIYHNLITELFFISLDHVFGMLRKRMGCLIIGKPRDMDFQWDCNVSGTLAIYILNTLLLKNLSQVLLYPQPLHCIH